MKIPRLQNFLIGLTGVLVGGLLVILAERRFGPSAQAHSLSPTEHAQPADFKTEVRLRALESRLTNGGPIQDLGAATDGIEADAGAVERPQLSFEQARDMAIQARDTRDRAFNAEYADPKWAREATDSFREDLERLGPMSRFTLDDVECRMSLCRAKVKWDSYHEANANWTHVLHAGYRKNCATEVYVPTPDKTDESYQASVFFDCTEDRAK